MPTPGFSTMALGTTTVTADPANDQSLIASSYSMPRPPQDSPPWEIVVSGNGGSTWASAGYPLPPYSQPLYGAAAATTLAIDGSRLYGWVAMPNGGYELWRWTTQRNPEGVYPAWHEPGSRSRATLRSEHRSQQPPEDLRRVYGNRHTWEFDPVDLQVFRTADGARSLLAARSIRLGPEWRRSAVVLVIRQDTAEPGVVTLAEQRAGRNVRLAVGRGRAYAAFVTLDDDRPPPASTGPAGPVPGTRRATLAVARDDGTRTFTALRRQVATGLPIGWAGLAVTADPSAPWVHWWEDDLAIAVDPDDPNRVAVACSTFDAAAPHRSTSRVWLSVDGGGTWTELERAGGVHPSLLFAPATGHLGVAFQQPAMPSHDPSPTLTMLEWRRPGGAFDRRVEVHRVNVRGAATPHLGRRTALAAAGGKIVVAYGAPDRSDDDGGPSARLSWSAVPSPERAGVG